MSKYLAILARNNKSFTRLLTDFFCDYNRVKDVILRMIAQGKTDDEIYSAIILFPMKKGETFMAERALRHSESRKTITLNAINLMNISGPINYIDYGAGEGQIILNFQSLIEKVLPGSLGYAVDVAEWHGHLNLSLINNTSENVVGIKLMDSILQLPTFFDLLPSIQEETIDVIYLDMVLHHLNEDSRSRLYRTMHRIMKKNSFILIREHGPQNMENYAYIEVQHALYGVKEALEAGARNPVEQYFRESYASYFSKEEWIREWNYFDFEVIYSPKLLTNLQYNMFKTSGPGSTFQEIIRPIKIPSSTPITLMIGPEIVLNRPISLTSFGYYTPGYEESHPERGLWIYTFIRTGDKQVIFENIASLTKLELTKQVKYPITNLNSSERSKEIAEFLYKSYLEFAAVNNNVLKSSNRIAANLASVKVLTDLGLDVIINNIGLYRPMWKSIYLLDK